MRRYLSTIHTKSEAHKKRFALGVSAATTLSIFAVWSFFMFSPVKSDTLAEVNAPKNPNEVSPFANLQGGVAASVQALKDQFNQVKGSVKQVDLQTQYEQMRADALKSGTNTNISNQNGY